MKNIKYKILDVEPVIVNEFRTETVDYSLQNIISNSIYEIIWESVGNSVMNTIDEYLAESAIESFYGCKIRGIR